MTGNGVPTEAELLAADLELQRKKYFPSDSQKLTQKELRAAELEQQGKDQVQDGRVVSGSEFPHPWAPRYPFLP